MAFARHLSHFPPKFCRVCVECTLHAWGPLLHDSAQQTTSKWKSEFERILHLKARWCHDSLVQDTHNKKTDRYESDSRTEFFMLPGSSRQVFRRSGGNTVRRVLISHEEKKYTYKDLQEKLTFHNTDNRSREHFPRRSCSSGQYRALGGYNTIVWHSLGQNITDSCHSSDNQLDDHGNQL